MDLLDWHRGDLSSRRLKVLIQHLPPRESAVLREVHGEAADWSVTDYLLANAVDLSAVANWMFATVNAAEGESPEFPQPTERPGLIPGHEPTEAPDAANDRDISTAEIATFFS